MTLNLNGWGTPDPQLNWKNKDGMPFNMFHEDALPVCKPSFSSWSRYAWRGPLCARTGIRAQSRSCSYTLVQRQHIMMNWFTGADRCRTAPTAAQEQPLIHIGASVGTLEPFSYLAQSVCHAQLDGDLPVSYSGLLDLSEGNTCRDDHRSTSSHKNVVPGILPPEHLRSVVSTGAAMRMSGSRPSGPDAMANTSWVFPDAADRHRSPPALAPTTDPQTPGTGRAEHDDALWRSA